MDTPRGADVYVSLAKDAELDVCGCLGRLTTSAAPADIPSSMVGAIAGPSPF